MAGIVDVVDGLPEVSPGTVWRGRLHFSQPTLSEWEWPVVVVRGVMDGPRLAVTSGVHPTEYPAIEANVRFAGGLDPARLRGTVVSLPIFTAPAFLARNPFVCPIDGLNPNRRFPGDPAGSFTDVMIDALWQAMIAPSDALIDLHGGDLFEELTPFTVYAAAGEVDRDAARSLGRAFGLPYLVPGKSDGLSVRAAAAAGIPAILVEAGGRGLLLEADVQWLTDGLARAMIHLGMLDGTPGTAPPVTEIAVSTVLTAPVAGWWRPAVAAGDWVTTGQILGRISDLFGSNRAVISAPFDGVVLYQTGNPAVSADGLLVYLGAP